jgi:hypothetical protein
MSEAARMNDVLSMKGGTEFRFVTDTSDSAKPDVTIKSSSNIKE